MRYAVEISDQAAADLRGIYEYIAFTLLDIFHHPDTFYHILNIFKLFNQESV